MLFKESTIAILMFLSVGFLFSAQNAVGQQITSNEICVDNQTLIKTSYFFVNNKVQNITIPLTCNFGCDIDNNICNPDTTTQTIYIIIIIGVIGLVAFFLLKRKGGI